MRPILAAIAALILSVGVVSQASGEVPQSVWTDVGRIVVIGDVHGEYDAFVTL